jgi:hypothetical protein
VTTPVEPSEPTRRAVRTPAQPHAPGPDDPRTGAGRIAGGRQGDGARVGLIVLVVVVTVAAIFGGVALIDAMNSGGGKPSGSSGIGPLASATGTGGSAPTTPATRSTAGAATGGDVVDAHPCVTVSRTGSLRQLPYLCPMIWSAPGANLPSVPVFRTYQTAGLTPASAIDVLLRSNDQYFACQIQGASYDFPAGNGLPAAHHIWWALSQGDQHNLWGFVPEVYLWGGPDNFPDPGITRVCTPADIAKVNVTPTGLPSGTPAPVPSA